MKAPFANRLRTKTGRRHGKQRSFQIDTLEDRRLLATDVLLGSVDQFSGPADLNLNASRVAYAINFSQDAPDVVVNGVNFQHDRQPIPGASLVGPREISPWGTTPEYGSTLDHDNLELVMRDMRWAQSPDQQVQANLDVIPGRSYELQVLVSEGADYNRRWDITVEGQLAVDEFTSLGASPGESYAIDRSTVYTYEFTAGDDQFNVTMGGVNQGANDGNDRNAIWQAVILTDTTAFDYVWDGTGDGVSWSDPGNWETDSGTPGSGDSVLFANADVGNVDLGGVTRSVASVDFDNLTGSFDLQNGTLVADSISQNKPGSNTISATVDASGNALAGSISFGSLRLGSIANSLAADDTLTVTGGELIGVAGATSSLGTAKVTLDGGTLTLDTFIPPLGGINSDLELWLDASDINGDGNPTTGEPADGAAITTWNDKSGNGHHANNVLSDPTLVASSAAANGQPVVNFDGDDELYLTDDLSNFLGADYSIFTVARYTDTDNERIISSKNSNWLFGFWSNSDERWYAKDWIQQTGGSGNTNLHVHSGTMQGVADPVANFWKDGNQLTVNSTGSSSVPTEYKPRQLSLGGEYFVNGTEFSRAEVAEVIIYDSLLSDVDRVAVEEYLAVKYGAGILPAAAADFSGTNVTVLSDSTINTTPNVTEATLGSVTIDNAAEVNLTGNGASLEVAGAFTLNAAATFTSPNTEVHFSDGIELGANDLALVNDAQVLISSAPVNGTGTIIKAGSGTLASEGDNAWNIDISLANSTTLASTSGTLTLNGEIDLGLLDLTFEGAGDLVHNGNITGSQIVTPSPTLSTLEAFAANDYSLTAASETFDARVDSHNGTNWLLVGRGREGWEFDANGQGTNAQVNQDLGTSAAFAPAAYSEAIVNDLLTQAGIDLTDVEIRLRRAQDPTGSSYQEARWRPLSQATWTWDFDVGDTGYAIDMEIVEGDLAVFSQANTDTYDTSVANIPNTAERVFTWAWTGHNSIQGFSFGSDVNNGTNNATSFLWEFNNENHAIPYTEVYIRRLNVGSNHITKNGTGTVTLTGDNHYVGETRVNEGTLVAEGSATALGTTDTGTTVAEGATLGLAGNLTLAGEAITVAGTGAAGRPGALVTVSGDNSVDTLVVNSSTTSVGLGAEAGSLTVTSDIDLLDAALTIDGVGNVSLPGDISGNTGAANFVPYEQAALALGANGYYSFDNVSGTTVVNEGTNGAVHDGELTGGASVTSSGGGLAGEALSSGADANIFRLNNNGIDVAAAGWTASVWFNDLNPSGDWRTLLRGDSTDHQVIVENTSLRLGVYDNANGQFRPSGYDNVNPVDDGQWHHLVARGNAGGTTTDSSTTDFFLDGVHVGTSDRRSLSELTTIGNHTGGTQPFASLLDEVAIYTRPLSEKEISLLSNSPTGMVDLSQVTPNEVIKNGTGTLTLSGDNSFNSATHVNQGTLLASSNTALGSDLGGTNVASGATLSLTGGIGIAGENFVLDGTGSTGQPGALVNLSGNNTIEASASVVAGAVSLGEFGIGSLAGTLTVNAPTDMAYSRLVIDGPGDLVLNGTVTGEGTDEITLANLSGLPTGNYTFTADSQTFTAHVDHDGTDSWLLIGRGREGWDMDTDGQGNPADVSTNLGVQAGFAPAAYSDALVNDLLAQAGLDNTDVEIRLHRAANVAGTEYQEARWSDFATTNFSFDFDSTIAATWEVDPSVLGTGLSPTGDETRDTLPASDNNQTRVFTFAYIGHNNQQGFSYGSAVMGVDVNDPNTFLWESGGENHAIPYTEVYLRSTTAGSLAGDNRLSKLGSGTLTLAAANTFDNGTSVTEGTLLAANSSGSATGPGNVNVTGSGIMGGSGSLAGDVTLTAGGTISPGAMLGEAATLGTGSLVVTSTGISLGEITSSGHDTVMVTGSVDLTDANGLLTLEDDFRPANGTEFVLIANDLADTIIGQLSDGDGGNLAEGDSFEISHMVNGVSRDRQFTFSYTGGDGNDLSVTFVNRGPVAAADTASTDEDMTFDSMTNSVLDNDTDADNDTLTVTEINSNPAAVGTSFVLPSGATVTMAADGIYTYAPATDFSGTDSFTYTTSDGELTATATVTVTIAPVADPVTLTLGDIGGADNEATEIAFPISVTLNDTDGSETITSVVITGVPTAAALSAGTNNGGGTWTLAEADLPGLTLTQDDGANPADTSTLTVEVNTSDTDALVPETTDSLQTSGMLDATIDNAPPAPSITGPASGVPGFELDFDYAANDPSSADSAAAFDYTVDWGDGSPPLSITGGTNSGTLSHTFGNMGDYTVTIFATDKDGETNAVAGSYEIDIVPVAMIDDDIYAGGSDAASDRIIFYPTLDGVRVRYNNTTYPTDGSSFSLNANTRLIAFGQGSNDQLIVSGRINAPAVFDGGTGNDYIAGGTMGDTLIGGEGNDIILGGEGDNVIIGDNREGTGPQGSDRLEGRSGDDTLFGGGGTDRLNGNAGDDILDGGDGNDFVFGGLDQDLILGGAGADTLNGYHGNDVILGGDSLDQLFGGGDHDLLIGGAGIDRVKGDSGDDTVAGGTSTLDDEIAAALATMLATEESTLASIDAAVETAIDNWFTSLDHTPFGLTGDTNDMDDLTGDTGVDTFYGASDRVRDLRDGETAY